MLCLHTIEESKDDFTKKRLKRLKRVKDIKHCVEPISFSQPMKHNFFLTLQINL